MRLTKYLGLTLALLLIGSAAQATTRYVSRSGVTPYTTIYSAVNASVSGDTVLVGPGVYSEGIAVVNRRLTVIGAGWDATQVTTIGVSYALSNGTVIEGF